MSLVVTLTQRLTDDLLARLASASVLPLAETKKYSATAIPTLVRQLAAPTSADEQNARWDMCRQLYAGQILTEADELLRTDMGWPDRRRYLAQKILGANQVATLAQVTTKPAQAETLLGYLTIITLATLGEQASSADLDPAALGQWLEQQPVPAATSPTTPPLQPVLRAQAAAPSQSAGKQKQITFLSVVGFLLAAGGVGSYFLFGNPANATQQEVAAAPPTAVVSSPAPEVVATVAAPAAAPSVALVATPAAVAQPLAAASKAPAAAATSAAVLRDTIGNAALARQVGGKFDIAKGRYLRGEGQPLIVKLANRATLTVGINSTESLLYKRLGNPRLPQPSDIALDRLAFDQGQAKLGAEGAQQLGNVASLLKTFPKIRILVVGHANNAEAQAIRLGLQRATAAVDELVKQGIKADRLQAQGMLATQLPTDNDSAEKQAMIQGISLKISRL